MLDQIESFFLKKVETSLLSFAEHVDANKNGKPDFTELMAFAKAATGGIKKAVTSVDTKAVISGVSAVAQGAEIVLKAMNKQQAAQGVQEAVTALQDGYKLAQEIFAAK